jgi:hypothetical protein
MYNILKRPMFKLGGQADQGSGIMSHVEPRQNYMFGSIAQPLTPFQTAYSDLQVQGYAMGGRIGYANGPGPVMPLPFGMSPVTLPKAGERVTPGDLSTVAETEIMKRKRLYDEEQRAIQQANREKAGIASIPIKGTPFFSMGVEEKDLYNKGYLTSDMTPNEKRIALENLKLARRAGEDYTNISSEDIQTGDDTRNQPTKKNKFTETETSNPKSRIKAESEMLRGLLKDEGLTTGENALLIARALATPGGINAKLAAAADMAIPLMRERSKINREAVLKAYEKESELEKARITAGKKDPAAQLTEDVVNRKIAIAVGIPGGTMTGADGVVRYKVGDEFKTRDEIALETLNIRTGVVPPSMRAEGMNKINTLQASIDRMKNEKNPNFVEIKKKEADIARIRKTLKGEYQDGGRVKKEFGGMGMDDTTQTETETAPSSTITDINVDGVPTKPVQKLSYEEIRNRLPQEITDDVVKLLADSSEALQDFAYIKTQQDVNQFNVKYGVNLVLPQNV